MKKILIFTLVLIVLASCTAPQTQPVPVTDSAGTPQANMPNPASVYCVQQGNRLEIRTAADGSQAGVCIFADGSECDEWAYFRGECQPAIPPTTPEETAPPTSTEPAPEAASDIASDGCKIYRNADLGYSFHYPADAAVISNDDPLHGITIVGPVIDNAAWPAFSISHPGDREDYHPPENADLFQWLTDHYLLGETRLPDIQIAGTTAIHFRHERSPQSPADDRYYFARAGQLYQIIIGHTGPQEDWELYNHFLESFQFDQMAANTPSAIPTAFPIDPADYQGWWTYTHPLHGFSIMLPEDWVVEEITTFDPQMSGHALDIYPQFNTDSENIHMSFRRVGEEVLIWPTGVGQGEFIPQGTLEVAGEPAQRMLLVCPTGEVTAIWYYQEEGKPIIPRGDMEFGFIFTYAGHCQSGFSLGGKVQRVGEMIIASLQVP